MTKCKEYVSRVQPKPISKELYDYFIYCFYKIPLSNVVFWPFVAAVFYYFPTVFYKGENLLVMGFIHLFVAFHTWEGVRKSFEVQQHFLLVRVSIQGSLLFTWAILASILLFDVFNLVWLPRIVFFISSTLFVLLHYYFIGIEPTFNVELPKEHRPFTKLNIYVLQIAAIHIVFAVFLYCFLTNNRGICLSIIFVSFFFSVDAYSYTFTPQYLIRRKPMIMDYDEDHNVLKVVTISQLEPGDLGMYEEEKNEEKPKIKRKRRKRNKKKNVVEKKKDKFEIIDEINLP